MTSILYSLEDEIALEGLDGITLDSLWFRMSERLKIELPFFESFKNKLWKIILKQECFEFFLIEHPRKTVGPLDRIRFIAGEETALEQVKEFYNIYSWAPVDDPEIRGSCEEFKTRKPVHRDEIENKTVAEIDSTYGQRLVIVANQKLRNKALIPANICRDVDINNHVYCMLERIGRSRYFGEATSGPYSINNYLKDSKLIHYFRSCLLKSNLVVRQQFSAKAINKLSNFSQLFHLPRFFSIIQSTQLRHVETLVSHLLTKENYAASLDEIRNLLQLGSKTTISNIRARPDIFEYRQFLYSEIFPNASRKESTFKKGHDRKITAVKLINPDFNIFELFKDENTEKEQDEEGNGFLDVTRQHVKRPLLPQIMEAIKESKSKGLSQSDIGNYFGLSRLNSRSVIRKAIKQTQNVTSYLKDEGRQRVSIFITKEHLSDKNKEFVDQVAKILKTTEETATQISNCTTLPYELEYAQDDSNSSTKLDDAVPLVPKIKQESLNDKSVMNITNIQFDSSPTTAPENAIFTVPKLPKPLKTNDEVFIVMPSSDCSFVDNIENVKVTLKILNNIPGVQKQFTGLQKAISENKVSQKVLLRMNIILDVLKEKTVIDTANLLHMLRQKEVNFSELCCRKSMLTLCGRLAADNLIKVIEMELISATNVVKLIFFGIPTVTFDMRCWNSIIEEQKIQHFISVPRPKIEKTEDFVNRTISCITLESQASIAYGEFDAQSTSNEHFPKFMKYRLFHEFLFYLIYNYPTDIEKIPVKKAIEIWKRQNQRLTDYDEIAERISTCYSTEINWKMFIPPLNEHIEYTTGWGLVRDIVHRIPLILFVKFTRFAHKTPELDDYIMHPIKCNYLLHFLPPKLRSQLFQGRKFVSAVSDLCKRLCWLGLLQFGAQRTKEIDQTYVYLNRNAMLLDTRSSDVGYLEVSEKEYPKLSFYFDSFDTLTNYWTSMFDICINTRINKKNTAIGKTIILEQLNTKPQLIEALKPQTPQSAPLNDNGEIPGDRKGAGGLDKAFMSHLKQSWSRTINNKKRRPESAFSIDRSVKRAKKENIETKKRKKIVKASVTSQTARPKASITNTSKSKNVLPSRYIGNTVGSKSKIIRKVKPRKRTIKEMKKRNEMYDEVDKEALKLMKTLRVTWSEIEDKTLLLSKVAMKFAFPNEAQRSHYVNSTIVRDILHFRTDRALNKTSKACQRRISYLMKNNKQFREQTYLTLEELRANREFMSKYHNFAERLKKIYSQEQIYNAVKIHLVEMIYRMHQIFLKEFLDNSSENQRAVPLLDLPQDYNEVLKKFKIVNPNEMIIDHKYTEPTTPTEIEISILSSLIHGAVCSANDKISNTYYLLETYKKFSDDNLGAAVSRLRQLAVVSLNKSQRSRDKVVMPYSISPFHLSNRYASQLMSIHVPVELYDEYIESIRALSCNMDKTYTLKSVNCGWIIMLSEMLNLRKISISMEKTLTPDVTVRKKTIFDRFNENYLIMKRDEEQQKSVNKSTRLFRLPVDSNSDEKFIFNDDPLEIFFKLDSKYLHIFCILQSIEHHQRNDIENWSIQEDDEECTFKHCIIRAGASFSIEIQKIACHCFKIVKSILSDEEPGPSKYDENAITKYNLVKFFDNFIEKYSEEKQTAMRKDVGKINIDEFHHKISTKFLLHAIQRLSTEIDIEDGAWLTEYKKISHKNDDEIFDDDEDADIITKSTLQSKEFNINVKSSDSFVVNLSYISVEVKSNEKKNMLAIDGETFSQELTPFNESTRSEIIEKIKKMYIWMPQDLIKKTYEEDMNNVVLARKDEEMTKNIYKFLKSKRHNGATIINILSHFGKNIKDQVNKIIDTLIQNKLILKTGVNEVRFVHKEYAAFWLVDTFFLTPKDPNIIEDSAKKAKVDDKLTRVPTDNNEMAMDIEETPEVPSQPSTSHQQQQTNKQTLSEEKRNLIRNSYYLLSTPWVRVGPLNRILNRRCIDKWLGTVLNHVSINPCILLSDLCTKFNIITPFNVYNLCEILELIGCVKLMTYSPLSVTIFSTYDENNEKISPATHLDSFDRIFIEPNTDAFHRLAFFIGKKKYKIPFV